MKPTALALCLLAGCAAPTPHYDGNFGAAVRAARVQQTMNPEAGSQPDKLAGVDGPAAKEAIGRYHDSFKAPPPAVNVINIGGAIAGGK